MTTMTLWRALGRPGYLVSSFPLRALGYLLFSAVWGISWLVLTALMLLLAPLWALVIGAVERRRTTWLGFPRQPSPHVRIPRHERHHRLGIRLSEPATWREVGALFVDILFGVMSVTVLLALALPPVLLVAFIFAATSGSDSVVTLWSGVRFVPTPQQIPLFVVGILVSVAVASYALGAVTGAQASLLRLLCAPRDLELAERVEQLTAARAALVRAQEDERRRIERDLHDGVQQELVALSTRLAIAELTAEEAPVEVQRAIANARRLADGALASLRRTVHGLHPTVLTDRGLTAALAELASRSALQVTLDLDVSRLPSDVETAAYYVVSEAITNAAKHSTASRVRVQARVIGGRLRVTCADDGGGRIDESAGTGITGLRERASSLHGSLTVGAGTRGVELALELPVTQNEVAHAHPAR